MVTVAGDPRAAGSVRRIKSRSGLAGFAIAAYASWHHGLPAEEVGLRALAGGVAAQFAGWTAAVAAWRHVLRARARVLAASAPPQRADGAEVDG